MRKAAKPFEFFFLRIAFFHFNHRILSLESSYSFPYPFIKTSKADFIGLFAAVTEILNTGCLIVLGKIIVHAYIRAKEMWFVKRQ